MTHWRRINLFLLGLLLCCCPPQRLRAQESGTLEDLLHNPDGTAVTPNSSAPSSGDWNGYLKKGGYGYRDSLEERAQKAEKKPEEKAPKKKEPSPGLFARLLQKLSELLSGPLGIVLISLLVLGVVAYLVYKIVGPGGLTRVRGRGLAAKQPVDETADEDLASDWESRMRRAEAAGDLRLAVRCGYMRLLQLLQETGEIRHRQDKTNADYHREIGRPELKAAFRDLSRVYEFSWYGQYPPSAAAYARFKHLFTSTTSSLQPA